MNSKFKSFDQAFNVLDIVRSASIRLKQDNVKIARGVIEHLPEHHQETMRMVLGAIDMGVIPSVKLCDEAITMLKASAGDMRD